MKIFMVLTIFAISASMASALVSCRDEYRCTRSETCWNGVCVRADPKAEERHRLIKDSWTVKRARRGRCDTTRDCKGFGFGTVCSNGRCRAIA